MKIEFRSGCSFILFLRFMKSVMLLFQSHQSVSFIFEPITAFVENSEMISIGRYFSYIFKHFMFMINNTSICLANFIIVSCYHTFALGRLFPKVTHPQGLYSPKGFGLRRALSLSKNQLNFFSDYWQMHMRFKNLNLDLFTHVPPGKGLS